MSTVTPMLVSRLGDDCLARATAPGSLRARRTTSISRPPVDFGASATVA
jgi:hypothetical protein